MKILANDGISQSGITTLEKAGFEVMTTRVAPEQLIDFINMQGIDALLVRSATQVRKELIDRCPGLKLIGRGGVGMDNIDVAYATAKGIHVINTPAASSGSVAELVFAHLYGGVRHLYDANRIMPLEGDTRFSQLKKNYSGGIELRGKTLGVIGFGKIGKATARIALGIGMNVLYCDPDISETTVGLPFFDGREITFELKSTSKEALLKASDFITLHVPAQSSYVIGKKEFDKMKKGVGIINASRGGVMDEIALIDAIESGMVSFAGLDVFESEPSPEIRIIMHPNISFPPNMGAATREAQDRIGLDLAQLVISLLR
jgi:D-3-phosphoglycerate dehydrogenase